MRRLLLALALGLAARSHAAGVAPRELGGDAIAARAERAHGDGARASSGRGEDVRGKGARAEVARAEDARSALAGAEEAHVGTHAEDTADEAFSAARAEWRRARDVASLERVLRAIVADSQGRATLIDLGPAREGRSLLAIAVGPAGAPGVLLCGGSGAAGEADVSAAIDLAAAIVRESDPRHDTWGARLADRRVTIIVSLRPDLLEPALEPLPFDPATNFPVDIDLASRAGGAPYPLAAPEARRLAEWVARQSEAYAALILGPGPLDPAGLATGDPASDCALADLAARPAFRAPAGRSTIEGESPAGGLARHLRMRAGLAVLGAPRPATARESAEILDGVIALLDAAPRLDLAADPHARPLGAGFFQVDLRLANTGSLPTGGAVHADEKLARSIELGLDAGTLHAAAVRRGDGPYEVLDPRPGAHGRPVLRLADLDRGAWVDVRLVVEPGARDRIEVVASAPRALGARLGLAVARER